MDNIYIRDLSLRCIVGVYEQERSEKQDVIVNITLSGDFSAACKSDRLEDALDYKQLKKRVMKLVENSQYNLIEALAGRIAACCLEDARVHQVTVSVDKPGALRFARSVACEINRKR